MNTKFDYASDLGSNCHQIHKKILGPTFEYSGNTSFVHTSFVPPSYILRNLLGPSLMPRGLIALNCKVIRRSMRIDTLAGKNGREPMA